jgi:hypothetical protein
VWVWVGGSLFHPFTTGVQHPRYDAIRDSHCRHHVPVFTGRTRVYSHGLCLGYVCVWPFVVHGGVLFLVFSSARFLDGGEVCAPAPLRSRWPEQACAGALISDCVPMVRLCHEAPHTPRTRVPNHPCPIVPHLIVLHGLGRWGHLGEDPVPLVARDLRAAR